MAELRAIENPGGQSAVVVADNAVVGGITLTSKGVYTVDTKGRIPALDGIQGRSPRDAWHGVVDRVRQGGVTYNATLNTSQGGYLTQLDDDAD